MAPRNSGEVVGIAEQAAALIAAAHAAPQVRIGFAWWSGFFFGFLPTHGFRFVFERLQGQADAFATWIDFQQFEVPFVSDVEHFVDTADASPRQLADVDQSFNTRLQLDEGTEISRASYLAVDDTLG